MRTLIAAIMALMITAPSFAETHTFTVEYEHNGQKLIGYLAYDDDTTGPRPGILVVHEWWGLNEYAKQRCRQLAEMGYVAFAADMYGDGKVTEHADEAGAWARQIQQNINDWQARAQLGLDILKDQPNVDANKLAVIGYCFGGATACQVAYSGADFKGIVSFHGSLPAPTEQQAQNIKAKILICHGSQDAFIPADSITQFQNALNNAEADFQFIAYSGAVHSFTNPTADGSINPGILYNAEADQRSWQHMQQFFAEIFAD